MKNPPARPRSRQPAPANLKRRALLKASVGIAALLPARRLFADAPTSSLPEIPATTLAGSTISLRGKDLRDLATRVSGQVFLQDDAGYDEARRVWNAVFDKQPAVLVRCASPSDAVHAVDFAREHRLLTAVRAGGHSLSGKSTCEGGIVIDVSPMQDVRVDPQRRIASVGGGALLRHLDRATSEFGLVTTTGTVSHTGAAGLTLGGGLGRVGRRFGLTCDNLRSVELVTAAGKRLVSSRGENPDLFWGLQGGGGNFGVATAFEYALHPMDPTILGGTIAWPIAQARDVLRFHAEFSARAPDELNLDIALVSLPEGAQIMIEACWSADLAQGERVLQPLRTFGKPAIDRIMPMRYLDLQSQSDGRLAHGIRFYGKSGFMTELADESIERLVDVFVSGPPGSFSIVLQQAGGAIGRRPISATAFPNRRANHWLMLSKSWKDPAEDARHVETLRRAWRSIAPVTRGLYVNSITDDDRSRVAENYGANHPRLQALKRRFDPDNQFRLNANVLPA